MIRTQIGIRLVILGLLLAIFSSFASAAALPSCSGPGASVNGIGGCCPVALTSDGLFYLYEEGGKCKVADGINGKNENQLCTDLLIPGGNINSARYNHYKPISTCTPAPEINIESCISACYETYLSCDYSCPRIALDDSGQYYPDNTCINSCSDNYGSCTDLCYADPPASSCYYSGADYLGWDENTVNQIKTTFSGQNPCDILYPQYSTKAPDANSFQYKYDVANNLVSVTDPYKVISKNFYSLGYMPGFAYSSWDLDTGTTTVDADSEGKVKYSKDSKGNVIYNSYDIHGRLVKMEAYCPADFYSVSGVLNHYGPSEVMQYYYDKTSGGVACSNVLSNSIGKVCETKSLSYECGQNPKTTPKFSYSVNYNYDDMRGRLTSEKTTLEKDNIKHSYTFEYTYYNDNKNNLKTLKYPDGRVVSYSYDNLGRVSTSYFKDERNLLENAGFENGQEHWTLGPNANIVQNQAEAHSGKNYTKGDCYSPYQEIPLEALKKGEKYDMKFWAKSINGNNVIKAEISVKEVKPTGEEVWGLRPTYCTFNDLTGSWKQYECEANLPLDWNDNTVTGVYYILWVGNQCSTQQFAVDDVELIQQTPTSIDSQFSYEPTGLISERTTDDLSWSYEYNIMDNMESFDVSRLNNNIFGRSYSFDLAGNIKGVEYSSKVPAPNINDEQFQYDNLNRLTFAQYQTPSLKTLDYDYDFAGNIVSLSELQKTSLNYNYNGYSYGQNTNRLTSIGSEWNFQYDTLGNVVVMNKPQMENMEFKYDALNRLVETKKAGVVVSTNYYNPSGKRVLKIGSDKKTYYVYRGDDVVYEESYPTKLILEDLNEVVSNTNEVVMITPKGYAPENKKVTYYIQDNAGSDIAEKFSKYGNKFSMVASSSDVGVHSLKIIATAPGETPVAKDFTLTINSYVCGDSDGNGLVTISDAVHLINYIFAGGPAPSPLVSGDADGTGIITISDPVYLINYIFAGGNAPCQTPQGYTTKYDSWTREQIEAYMKEVQIPVKPKVNEEAAIVGRPEA